jgi:hypothetical protein
MMAVWGVRISETQKHVKLGNILAHKVILVDVHVT